MKEIELPNALENMGAQVVKEAATKTSDLAGDGTTTATVLAQAIVREGFDKNAGSEGSIVAEKVRASKVGWAECTSGLAPRFGED